MSPLWIAAFVAAIGYFGVLLRGRTHALKVLPALLLAVDAWGQPAFVAAFALCALGDALLLDKARFFLFGLVAFLLGHVAFMVGFWPHTGPVPAWAWPVFGGVAVGMLVALLPRVRGVLRVAVPVYASALVGLAVTGVATSPVAAVGASVFLVSDALLAWNRFRSPVPRADLWVMSTYYAALLSLAAARPPVS